MYLPTDLPALAAQIMADITEYSVDGSVKWKASQVVPEAWDFEYEHGYRHAIMVTYVALDYSGRRFQADYGVMEDGTVHLWAN